MNKCERRGLERTGVRRRSTTWPSSMVVGARGTLARFGTRVLGDWKAITTIDRLYRRVSTNDNGAGTPRL